MRKRLQAMGFRPAVCMQWHRDADNAIECRLPQGSHIRFADVFKYVVFEHALIIITLRGVFRMKACQKCGQPLEESELFCAFCGAKFEEKPAPPEGVGGGFCPNCGERIEADTVFCPNCGANTQTGEAASVGVGVLGTTQPKKPVSHRLVGIVAIVAAVVVVIAGVAFAGKLFQSPADVFVASQREFLMTEGVEQLVALADQYNSYVSLSTDIVISAEADSNEAMEYLEDSLLALKLNVDRQSFLLNADLTVMGSSLLKGSVTYNAGILGIYLPEADPTYYTMDLSTLMETYGGVSGFDLSKLEIPEIPSSTLNKLGKLYIDVVLGAVNKDNVTRSDKDKIRLEQLGKSVEGKLYVFEPTAEDLEAMLLKLADTIEKDKELRNFVNTVLGGNKEFLDEVLDFDTERELDNALLDAADSLRDNAESMADALERAGFTWTLGVSGDRVCLQKIGVKDGEEFFVYESWGEESKERRDAVYYSSYDSVQWGTETSSSKSGNTYSGKVSVTQDGSTVLAVKYKDMNKEKKSALGVAHGTYTFSMDDYGFTNMDISLTVAPAKDGGTDHIFRVDGIDDYTFGDWVEVRLQTSDKKSTAAKPNGKVEDISDYDSNEFYTLFNDLGSALSRQMNDLMNG